jgi:predicted transcriptional regulator
MFYEDLRKYRPCAVTEGYMNDQAFTERELDIMSVLWKRRSGSVAEVREALGSSVGYTTVLKLLQILEEKGAVRHEEEGRAYRYFPVVQPETAGGSALSRILDKIFGGSAELLLSQLVSDRTIPAEELARMRRILEDMEEES